MATPKKKGRKPRRIPGVSPSCSTAARGLRNTKGTSGRSTRRKKLSAKKLHTACPPSGQGARRKGESAKTIKARAFAARVATRVAKGMSLKKARISARRPLKPGSRIRIKK